MSATRVLSGARSRARNRGQATGVAPLPVEHVPRSYLLPGTRRVLLGCSLGGQEEIGGDPLGAGGRVDCRATGSRTISLCPPNRMGGGGGLPSAPLPASSIMHHTTHAAAAHSGGLRGREGEREEERQSRGSSLTDRPRAAAWGGTEGGRAKGTPDQTLF